MQPVLYRSEEILALEQERIFNREFLCVGRALDIPEPGSYLTARIGDQPVLTIRGKDGGCSTRKGRSAGQTGGGSGRGEDDLQRLFPS